MYGAVLLRKRLFSYTPLASISTMSSLAVYEKLFQAVSLNRSALEARITIELTSPVNCTLLNSYSRPWGRAKFPTRGAVQTKRIVLMQTSHKFFFVLIGHRFNGV